MKNNDSNQIRVRFAPSPTGLLHVGSFRTALFNWLFARKQGGKFILRIEDTDRLRSKEEYLQSQLADMRWMGLDWDEGPDVGGSYGPYRQMERLDIYKKYTELLLEKGLAYYCYCTPDELKHERTKIEEKGNEPGYSGRCRNIQAKEAEKLRIEGRKPCIRFKSPSQGEIVIDDAIKGRVSFKNSLLDDFVIMKSDWIPTYNYAVVIDDHLMKISHVIRGDEHMSNTPRQVLLYDAFGFQRPVFCHIPIILNEDKTKLSKRKGAVHLLDYRDRGYLKEAIFNFLALLGWAPKDDREIMSPQEILKAFSIDGIAKHPAVFNEEKLQWMNGQYINCRPVPDLIAELKPFIRKAGFNPDLKETAWYEKAIFLYRERIKTLVEFVENLSYYFTDKVEYDEKGVKKHFKEPYLADALSELAEIFNKDMLFTPESLEGSLRSYAEAKNYHAGKLIHAVRLACTGRTATPPLFDCLVLLGREKTMARLAEASVFVKKYQQQQVTAAS